MAVIDSLNTHLQYHNTSTLSNHKTGSVLVEGSTSFSWTVIPISREAPCACEA